MCRSIPLPGSGEAVDEYRRGSPRHSIWTGAVALKRVAQAAGAFPANEHIGASLQARSAGVRAVAVVSRAGVMASYGGSSRHDFEFYYQVV